ncbi:hypothetical protein JVT61DRAFT_15215 [Boletus reticuloceps]|uniref:Kinetochore protein Sos7 coiled-coil domain-containing protein n=1 Tax=Boletus reticuloceps TaxID=495285 RepID=A0A8I2YSN6_9AGAM|nr:hypothetical protein JVT61DRAFT_15215 [Boletus reticuloceps]
MSTLDASKQLQTTLDNTNLYILNARGQLKSHRFDNLDDLPAGEDALSDPAVVASDVAAQASFLRQLKFQYLEQKAKDKFVKTIVSDDAPLITASSNEELRLRNEEKKRVLKEAKAALGERQEDIRTLAPLVEEDYRKARSSTSLATTLSAQILDARLALTRLRQAHPHPRLTIASATSTLDDQVEQMQKMEDELQRLNSRMADRKERLKREMAETGANEKHRKGKTCRAQADRKRGWRGRGPTGRRALRLVRNSYPNFGVTSDSSHHTNRFVSSLSVHRTLFSLESTHVESENELRLTYTINPPPGSASPEPNDLVLTLLFIPNTRQLVSVDVTLGGVELELGDVVDPRVQANDISGLVWTVLALARVLGPNGEMGD